MCRVPIASVEIKLQGQWLPMKRTVNNQWPYYNTNGPWQTAFPIPVRVTSVVGEVIEDTITGVKGNQGTKQFSEVSGSVRARSARQAPCCHMRTPFQTAPSFRWHLQVACMVFLPRPPEPLLCTSC